MYKIQIYYQSYPVMVPYTELFQTKEAALKRLKELVYYKPDVPFDASFSDLQMVVEVLTSGGVEVTNFQDPEYQEMFAEFAEILKRNTDEHLCKYYIKEVTV